MAFPRKLAEGSAFCNRETEKAHLTKNIRQGEHTLIISPRRYGKTSLALKVIQEMKIPFSHVDLFLALDNDKVIERFLNGTAELINSLMSMNTKSIIAIKEFFKTFNLSLSIGKVSMGIKFEPPKKNTERILLDALGGLESFLSKKNKQAVFFIDEMQDIVNLPVCSEIEFSLRSFAQKSKHISFIFSGSNRKLLKKIFEDRSRPLWKLCDKINLQRISKEDYTKFINKASKKKWGNKLESNTLETILELTECHSYYVNYLCSELWAKTELPTNSMVEKTWLALCALEEPVVAELLDDLSDNQKKLLVYTANKKEWFQPTSNQSVSELKMSSRGILQSLKGLIERDFVETIMANQQKGYHVLDPMMRQVLL